MPDVRDSQALGPNNAQQFKTYFHDVPGTRPLVSHLVQEGLLPLPLPSPLLALALAVAEDDTCPPEEECACVSEECGGG